jgi:hypothetical protein
MGRIHAKQLFIAKIFQDPNKSTVAEQAGHTQFHFQQQMHVREFTTYFTD